MEEWQLISVCESLANSLPPPLAKGRGFLYSFTHLMNDWIISVWGSIRMSSYFLSLSFFHLKKIGLHFWRVGSALKFCVLQFFSAIVAISSAHLGIAVSADSRQLCESTWSNVSSKFTNKGQISQSTTRHGERLMKHMENWIIGPLFPWQRDCCEAKCSQDPSAF